jgi:O-antigen ligase
LLFYYLSLRKLLDRDRHFVMQVAAVMVGVAFFEALYGLLQFMNSGMGVLWLPSSLGAAGVARGTIIYRNQYATLLNMCWPLALAVAALNIKKRPPALFLFGAGMIILAVLFSLSRGGIIALLCIAVFLGAGMPFPRREKVRAVLVLVIFLAVYGALLGGYGTLLQRFADFKSGAGERFSIWCMSLPMLFDHPLTGIGLESYIRLSPLYIKNGSGTLLWDRAHNEFLELAIELGWPAMLLFCAFLFSGLSGLARRLRRRQDLLIGMAAFAGICGFFIHGLVDFGWHLPANCVYCVTLLALLGAELGKLPGSDGII